MKIKDILTENTEYASLQDGEVYGNEELDYYELMGQAEALVKQSGLQMLRDDEITDVALDGDTVVGVLYSSTDNEELHWSIAVQPQYQSRGIAKGLYDRLSPDMESTLVAELIAPFTLEKFVQDRGYELVGSDDRFRVYKLNILT